MNKALTQRELKVLADRLINCGVYPFLICNLQMLLKILLEQEELGARWDLSEQCSIACNKAIQLTRSLSKDDASELNRIMALIPWVWKDLRGMERMHKEKEGAK